jgi:hypothetical protein
MFFRPVQAPLSDVVSQVVRAWLLEMLRFSGD